MNRKNVTLLAALVAGLALLLAVFQGSEHRDSREDGDAFLAGFAGHANDLQLVEILRPDDAGTVTLQRDGDTWKVRSHDGYRADVGRLGRLVSELADARIVEDKTSDPDKYGRLGVDDPAEGGSGTKLTFEGDGFVYEVLLGNVAQADYRYARVAGQDTSYLVDRRLELPSDAEDWLLRDIADIPASAVRRVTIEHADGETVVVEKSAREDADFAVLDLPDGRELSHPGAGNGIAGALAGLTFESVRPAVDGETVATVTFETWDEQTITVTVTGDEGDKWLALSAAGDDARNARWSGWQYRVADYQQNRFLRRLDDLLKAP